MILDEIDRMDRRAATGSSPLHRASPAARTLASVAALVAAVLSEDPRGPAAVAGILLVLGAVAGENPLRLLLRALAPLPFLGVIFLLHAEMEPERLLLLVLRAVASALSLVLLLSTTPFSDVLRVLAPFVPRSLAAALAVLYRSLFILLRASAHALEAARLRGVRGGAGALVGGVLLVAFERTENVACVLHVRGVDVPDPDRADAFRPRPWDALPLAAAAGAAAAAILAGGGA